jgi:hypothetical protein
LLGTKTAGGNGGFIYVLKHRRAAFGAILGLAVLAFAGATMAATTKVVVTPTNNQGWVLDTVALGNGPVATDFNGPSDSDGGNGSLHFGPIAGAGASKLELQPPEVNKLVTAFGGFDLEYQILAAPTGGGDAEDHFYVNVYVDSAANGIGFFGSAVGSTGFYDCRYVFIATSNAAGWNSLSFGPGTSPSSPVTSRHASCTANLAGFSDNSEIRFFRISGGDSSVNDNGLEGAYDLVGITFSGNTKLYDFEPYAVADDKEDCKKGGWQSVFRDDGSSFKNQGDCIQYANTGN